MARGLGSPREGIVNVTTVRDRLGGRLRTDEKSPLLPTENPDPESGKSGKKPLKGGGAVRG
jgi:hypothetical protein